MCREIWWLSFSLPLLIWSFTLIVSWERMGPPRLLTWHQLLQPTVTTALWAFRLVFNLHLIGFSIGAIAYVVLIGDCWSRGHGVTSKSCVLDLDVPWKLLVFSAFQSVATLLAMISFMSHLFTCTYNAAHVPNQDSDNQSHSPEQQLEDGHDQSRPIGPIFYTIIVTLWIAATVLGAVLYAK